MRITTYSMRLNEDRINHLVKESATNYGETPAISGPKDIADMVNRIFDLANRPEEHVYMIALSTNNAVKGVFEISHGGLAAAPVHPREIFSRAVLVGAASIS